MLPLYWIAVSHKLKLDIYFLRCSTNEKEFYRLVLIKKTFFTAQSSSSASSHTPSISLPPLLALLTSFFQPSSSSPPLSPLLHHLHTSPLYHLTLISSLTSSLPLILLLPLSHFSPPPLLSIFPSPPSSLISLVNNSAAVHTWVVIAELHLGGGGSGRQINHKDGGIKNFPTAPLQGQRNLPPACLPARLKPVCASFSLSSPRC